MKDNRPTVVQRPSSLKNRPDGWGDEKMILYTRKSKYSKIVVGEEGQMKMEPALLQKQTLNLTMTQELQQAITILQYTAHELTAFLEMKEMENPLIQLESPIVQSVDPRYDMVKKRKITNQEHDQKKWLEQMAEPTENLADHLFSQLLMKALSEKQRKLAEQFIYNLILTVI